MVLGISISHILFGCVDFALKAIAVGIGISIILAVMRPVLIVVLVIWFFFFDLILTPVFLGLALILALVFALKLICLYLISLLGYSVDLKPTITSISSVPLTFLKWKFTTPLGMIGQIVTKSISIDEEVRDQNQTESQKPPREETKTNTNSGHDKKAKESQKSESGEVPPKPHPEPAKDKDPYAVLGVSQGASQAEIRAAYRKKMLKNHPDRVASLDPEFERLANERSLAIQQAYQSLIGNGP